ncbi:MAG TPA: hypothetical protein VNT03_11705 [Baekduia sp.]|nr:hypothetical protein [Baekduia sp.]
MTRGAVAVLATAAASDDIAARDLRRGRTAVVGQGHHDPAQIAR